MALKALRGVLSQCPPQPFVCLTRDWRNQLDLPLHWDEVCWGFACSEKALVGFCVYV